MSDVVLVKGGAERGYGKRRIGRSAYGARRWRRGVGVLEWQAMAISMGDFWAGGKRHACQAKATTGKGWPGWRDDGGRHPICRECGKAITEGGTLYSIAMLKAAP